MKLASFEAQGAPSFGLVRGDALVDLGARLRGRHHGLRALIASGELDQVAAEHGDAPADWRLDEVSLLPPITDPINLISTGANFPGHIAEMMKAGMSKGPPKIPGFHIRTMSGLVGHGQAIVRPASSTQLDYECELAVIIATPGRHIAAEQAMTHVLGYACFNDGSVRDYQLGHSVAAGKNFDRSGSFGPWITTADEVGDIAARHISTRVNGELMQHERIGDLTFGVAELIAYMSGIFHLRPGDVITTGTAGGVGIFRDPPFYMKAGDRLEIEVDGVGILANHIVDEDASDAV
jgi:2-keto-4-pentenoate hydratase/2-oxohepta-3-ene-1,7-dioic acid hydratase in catechol pathway